MLLLDYAREELGMPMRGFHFRHIGWTTDNEKAAAIGEAGATVQRVTDSGRLLGFEISFPRDTEVREAASSTASAES